jgi:hypothetical protein
MRITVSQGFAPDDFPGTATAGMPNGSIWNGETDDYLITIARPIPAPRTTPISGTRPKVCRLIQRLDWTLPDVSGDVGRGTPGSVCARHRRAQLPVQRARCSTSTHFLAPSKVVARAAASRSTPSPTAVSISRAVSGRSQRLPARAEHPVRGDRVRGHDDVRPGRMRGATASTRASPAGRVLDLRL